MQYVGVPNGEKKTALVGRDPVETIYVSATDLAHDCQRHIDFLKTFAEVKAPPKPRELLKTDYAKWLKSSGRTDSSVTEKCLGFLRHYIRIRDGKEPETWAIVTEDGLRLDGSHRAAIACVLGKGTVPVSVVPYHAFDLGWQKKMAEIREKKITGQWRDDGTT